VPGEARVGGRSAQRTPNPRPSEAATPATRADAPPAAAAEPPAVAADSLAAGESPAAEAAAPVATDGDTAAHSSVAPTAAEALVVLGLMMLVVGPAGGLAVLRHFDGLYGQDAYAYFDYASGPLRQALASGQPWPPFFWPPGYPLLVSLVSFVLGPQPLAGQLVSLAMGALVPVCTYGLVRELWPDDRPLALTSAAICGLCGQLWQSSIVVMSDTTGLALATLGAWAVARYARRQQVRWLLLAALALAWATLARWIYGLVAIPLAIFALLVLPRDRRGLGHALLALALSAALLVPVLGPSLLELLRQPAAPASFAGNLQVYAWSPLNALSRDFVTADGRLHYALPNGLYYAALAAHPAYLALLAPAIAIGVWAVLRAPRRGSLLLVVGWVAVVYAFHAGAAWQNIRFLLAALPPLAICAGLGLLVAWRGLRPRRRWAARLVLAWGVLGVLVMGIGGVRLVRGFIDRKDDDLALVRWLELDVPAGSQVLSFGPTLTIQHYSGLPTRDLYELEPGDLPGVLATAPTYVLLDVGNVEDQWQGQTPERDLRALEAGPGLVPIDERAGLSLFRVGGR
jgi:hypothetical protein